MNTWTQWEGLLAQPGIAWEGVLLMAALLLAAALCWWLARRRDRLVAMAEALRALDIPYIALNPGASFRGFHDSLVNYLGNEQPQMLLCLHEEHAVGIAHGYAMVTNQPLIAIVHSNVGLMHGTMALYNAFCDRAPMFVLGATGPVDASQRRPWIDWIHTSADQAGMMHTLLAGIDLSENGQAMDAISAFIACSVLSRSPGRTYTCSRCSLPERATMRCSRHTS